jgi:DedD protein
LVYTEISHWNLLLMDRQLAERMVGAACLLAVLVLVVPAILDGDPDSGATMTHPPLDESTGLRTHTIRLDSAAREPPVPTAGQAKTSPEPSSPPAPAPEPVPEPVSEPVSESVPAPVPASALPAREPVRSLAQEAQAAGGEWFVQLGSFSRRENSDRLAAQLKGKGFRVSVLGGGGASGSLFRVRAGPEGDRAAAEALAERLAAAGFTGGRVGRQ